MMERYLITLDDLIELQRLACAYGRNGTVGNFSAMGAQQKACREIEVPDWATHFAGDHVAGNEFMKSEEIP